MLITKGSILLITLVYSGRLHTYLSMSKARGFLQLISGRRPFLCIGILYGGSKLRWLPMAGIMPRQNRSNACKDIDRCGMSSVPPQLVPETASLKILC